MTREELMAERSAIMDARRVRHAVHRRAVAEERARFTDPTQAARHVNETFASGAAERRRLDERDERRIAEIDAEVQRLATPAEEL